MQIRYLSHCIKHDTYLTIVISAVKENYSIARVIIVNKKEVVEICSGFQGKH